MANEPAIGQRSTRMERARELIGAVSRAACSVCFLPRLRGRGGEGGWRYLPKIARPPPPTPPHKGEGSTPSMWRQRASSTNEHALEETTVEQEPRATLRVSVRMKPPATHHTPVCATIVFCVIAAIAVTAARAQTAAADNSAIYMYQGADRGERLIAKAREEGTLTVYTSMATTESGPLAQAFEKKYGVKVQLWRALSENVLQRALTEARGGRRAMDVVETNAPEVAEFDTPYIADLPAWAVSSHRRWLSDRANLWVTGYNTGKLKREDVPPTLE